MDIRFESGIRFKLAQSQEETKIIMNKVFQRFAQRRELITTLNIENINIDKCILNDEIWVRGDLVLKIEEKEEIG